MPPRPWHHVYRLAERLTGGLKRPVIFECVGSQGSSTTITHAPLQSRIVVGRVCMVSDTIGPAMAVNKEIELRFVVGYSPLEFRGTLHLLADDKVDASPLVTGTGTGTGGLNGVEGAFDALRDPEHHAKILIDPSSSVLLPPPTTTGALVWDCPILQSQDRRWIEA